jgi:hypothetical protein
VKNPPVNPRRTSRSGDRAKREAGKATPGSTPKAHRTANAKEKWRSGSTRLSPRVNPS